MRQALLAASFALLATPLAAQQAERFTLQGPSVAVYNLVGTMRVVGGDGGAVVAEVTRGGPDASKLRIETGPLRGRQTLRVVYPGSDIVARELGSGSTTQTRVTDEGTFDDNSGSGGHRVYITGSGSGLEARADVTLRVPKGQKVAVYLAVGEATVTNVDGDIKIDVAAARVTTTGTRGRLELDTGSGDVSVTDAQGDLSFDTGSGDVRVSRIRGTELEIDAGSGGLSGGDVSVERLNLDLGSGGARLTGVRADEISLESGSGDVDLAITGDVRTIDVDSGSGSVTLRVPPTLGATIEVDAGSGGVESDLPMTVTHRSRSELSGQIGDGKGRIKIDAGSGTVAFRKN